MATSDDLRQHVAEVLPDAMVPSVVRRLEAFPLTPNGKIDRKALPADVGPLTSIDNTGSGLADDTERLVAGIWSSELERSVGRDDNFFDIGGHSLLGMQLISRLRDAFRVDLPVSSLFDAPTVEGLAAVLADRAGTVESVGQLAQLTLAVSRMSDDEVAARLKEADQP